MKWQNLIKNKCPKCGRKLIWEKEYIVCSRCNFGLSNRKFEELTLNINNNNLDDNQTNEDEYSRINRQFSEDV